METEPAKHLLHPISSTMNDFYYSDFNLNLYRGCCHGCIYCDSRSICYRLDRFDTVRAKANALNILNDELRCKKKPGVVSMGAMSDPYNPFEKTERLTLGALQLIRKYGFGIGLTTKSDLPARDRALLADIGRSNKAQVEFSITCADDELSLMIEPHAPPSSARFAAMKALADVGVLTGTWLNPVVPFITDEADNMVSILRQTKACGGRFAICFFGMTLRTGNREYFFQALDKQFPGVKDKYLKAFGSAYECASPKAEKLYEIFKAECDRLGLIRRFSELNRLALSTRASQLSFF